MESPNKQVHLGSISRIMAAVGEPEDPSPVDDEVSAELAAVALDPPPPPTGHHEPGIGQDCVRPPGTEE